VACSAKQHAFGCCAPAEIVPALPGAAKAHSAYAEENSEHLLQMEKLLKSAKDGFFRLLEVRLAVGRPRQRKKLAIFKADGIGDFVLSSEAIRQLIAAHGTNEVTLIVSLELRDLAAAIFPGVEIRAIAPGHATRRARIFRVAALRSAIASAAYDEVVCLRHYRTRYEDAILRALTTKRVVLLANQSAAGDRAIRDSTPGKFCVIGAEACETPGNIPREWSFHAAILSKSMGRHLSPDCMRPDWNGWPTPSKATAPFVLVSPLAGRRIRDLSPDLVRAAAGRAAASGLHRLILSSSQQQASRLEHYADTLRSALPNCRVDVQFPENLPALVDLVSCAALVVTAETSTAHIAAALNRPAVVLIGGGHYGLFAPWGRSAGQVWLAKPLPCFNCNWQCPYPKPLCLTEITAAEVEAATGEALRQAFLPRPVT
jgi:ADP-heptose:LPS heptosyltransferase